ncbi:hypothetical protein AXG93_464s1160 [Marchantia polymorpha subsp. ruderalis]|uniref:Uncharacterized protein n=1 Tax=Marchantia polymorpha subsp. ruderalis TaxID=1480154 RepID=A0A176WS60_MARPO|nr:hypothetical protein AXG93_464s1160 [Marchantia polymorpha subsp. ruderalis]
MLRHLQARHGVRRSSMATTQSRGMVRSKGRDVDGIEQDAAGGAGVEFNPQLLRSRLYRIGLIMACPPLATSVLDSSSSALALDGNAAAIAGAAMSDPWTSSASFELVHRLVGVPLADLDPDTAKLAITVLGPLFAFFNLLFIFRIVMSWYPQIPVSKFPFVLAYAPTEPILGPTRRLIPPVGGVDVAPVIWVALMSFLNEILLGKQGLFILLSQQQS